MTRYRKIRNSVPKEFMGTAIHVLCLDFTEIWSGWNHALFGWQKSSQNAVFGAILRPLGTERQKFAEKRAAWPCVSLWILVPVCSDLPELCPKNNHLPRRRVTAVNHNRSAGSYDGTTWCRMTSNCPWDKVDGYLWAGRYGQCCRSRADCWRWTEVIEIDWMIPRSQHVQLRYVYLTRHQQR